MAKITREVVAFPRRFGEADISPEQLIDRTGSENVALCCVMSQGTIVRKKTENYYY